MKRLREITQKKRTRNKKTPPNPVTVTLLPSHAPAWERCLRTRTFVYEPEAVWLPDDAWNVILALLRDEIGYRHHYDSAPRALRELAHVSRQLHRLVARLLQEQWSTAHAALHHALVEKNWHRQTPCLRPMVKTLLSCCYHFEHGYGLHEDYLRGRYARHGPLRVEHAVMHRVLAYFPDWHHGQHWRRKIRDAWYSRYPLEADQTFPQLLYFLHVWIDTDAELSRLLEIIVPEWCHERVDECLAYLLLWREEYSGIFDRGCQAFIYWFVRIVVTQKLGLPWPCPDNSYKQHCLLYDNHWENSTALLFHYWNEGTRPDVEQMLRYSSDEMKMTNLHLIEACALDALVSLPVKE